MGEEEKKEIIGAEESSTEEEAVAEDLESTEESEEVEPTPEAEEEDSAPVAGKGSRGVPADKAKIAKLKKGIESSIKRGVRAGQSRYLARSLAHIEARKKAVKLLGYVPKGFWADKD